ncbi:MAG: CHAT domain-containing protein [Cytophagales bacterium]|nr:MAG: CHAT domain-containing protein [Cytophagales bacterium]
MLSLRKIRFMKKITTPFIFVIFFCCSFSSVAQLKYDKYFESIDKAHKSGNYSSAMVLNEQAIAAIRQDLNKPTNAEDKMELTETLANLTHNKGHLLIEIGEYDEATLQIKHSLEILKEISDTETPDYATFLDNLALAYQSKGNYAEAEKLYLKARDIRLKFLSKQDPDYAVSLNHLASLAHEIGDYKKAKDLYIQSLHIIKNYDGKYSIEYANYQSNLAALYCEIGSYDYAEVMLKHSIGILKKAKLDTHPDYASVLMSLANVYQTTGQHEKALPLLQESIQIIREQLGDEHPMYAGALQQAGRANQTLGNNAKAENLYLQSLKLRGDILGTKHPDYTASLIQLALFYELIGKKDQAESYYRTHLEKSTAQIHEYFSFLSEKEKENFYTTLSESFEKFNGFAFENSNHNPQLISEMLNHRLTTKAILFNSASKVRQQILGSKNPALISLYKEWLAIKNRLARIYSPLKKIKVRILVEDIITLEKQAEQIEKELAEQSVAFQQFANNHLLSWQNIQTSLKKEEAAIEIIRFRYFDIRNSKWADSVNYIGLVVANQQQKYPYLVSLPNGKALENQYFKAYKYAIREKQTDVESYAHYWQPFKVHLDSAQKVFVSPDGIYNQLNINVLLNPSTGNYLLDELDVFMLANMKEIIEIAPPAASNEKKVSRAVLIGRPNYGQQKNLADLEGTETEVRNIAELLKGQDWETEVYLGEKALESVVKQSNSPTVLHIASHGFFTDETYEDPMLSSGLMLSTYRNEAAEDGLLTSYEAMGLSLENTDLVVLSACETGRGSIRNGEGVYGLQRAFKMAGAKNIMMSLWLADDWATQRLMKEFYQQWLRIGDRRKAFRLAQQKMKEKYAHPYYWGAFVMWGS